MRLSLATFAVCFGLLVAPAAARADYFVWTDTGTGMTLSFPDSWVRVASADPDDVLTVMAPSGRAHAMCRVRVRDDGRYKIFPARFDWAIQKTDFSLTFWDAYLREYNKSELYNLQNGAGLGRGWASFAEAGYKSAVPGPMMNRRAVLFASLYENSAYILECSSHKDAFADWKGPFLSIAKSIDFKPAHTQTVSGHYRNFTGDAPLLIKQPDGQSLAY